MNKDGREKRVNGMTLAELVAKERKEREQRKAEGEKVAAEVEEKEQVDFSACFRDLWPHCASVEPVWGHVDTLTWKVKIVPTENTEPLIRLGMEFPDPEPERRRFGMREPKLILKRARRPKDHDLAKLADVFPAEFSVTLVGPEEQGYGPRGSSIKRREIAEVKRFRVFPTEWFEALQAEVPEVTQLLSAASDFFRQEHEKRKRALIESIEEEVATAKETIEGCEKQRSEVQQALKLKQEEEA